METANLEISHCIVNVSSSFGSHRWFEGKVIAFENGKLINFNIDFPMEDMKELGVCKNLGNWKAIRAWVETDEGIDYIVRNKGRNYFDLIRGD